MRFLRLTSVSALLISIATSCHEKGGKFIDQGEIHYTIEYIRSSGTMSQELKPRNLVIAFKKDKILFEIMAPIGNQGIINVTNPESHIFDTYINMLGVRYYYAGSVGEVYPGFASMDGMEIIKTDRTEVICGYDCKNAVVTFPNNTKKYNIWYTDQIKVNNSNSNSPYSSIGGVLMSFYYILGGTEMKFEAETVYKKDIPDKAFERRGRFRPVSKKDMDKIITDMVNL